MCLVEIFPCLSMDVQLKRLISRKYADDTLFLGEATVDNLWTLKAILRSFELASGLKVNFAKSCVMGVNVSSDFLGLAEHFLHCRTGSLPFMYLGLPVGANPRKEITWRPLLDTLAKRLNDWQIRFGKVFLNCKDNSCGVDQKGRERLLGDLRCVNLALLAKWRWRLLERGHGIWRDILLARYGTLDPYTHPGGIGKKVGNGLLTSFWFEPWSGGTPLRVQYPRLFQVSHQQDSKVGEMGNWIYNDQDLWVWKHDATRIFSVKSTYSVLVSNLGVIVVSPEDRISSRQNLFRRNVITDPHNILCILCGMSIESVDHLFLTCDLSSSVWYSIFRWLGIQAVLPRGL
ncbi:hypothetical protein TSUD_17890 [Trifolium subterraneum]|uniref:Reverse transcriptase zinc-binding domain-containing protein n=1 Tax=Trifolium subterraneum TaxID=3900 RepID=A0A2Z6M0Q5_TRISU|nr:hypothetical protein TSUD_17890 [Trifolium subterraneum]